MTRLLDRLDALDPETRKQQMARLKRAAKTPETESGNARKVVEEMLAAIEARGEAAVREVIAKTGIPPFIATLGMMVSARGLAKWYTEGQPVALLNENFTWLGQSFDLWGFPVPRTVIVFFIIATICHIALCYTRYGKFTYAIGANPQAARVSGIDIGKHLIKVYAVAGLLSGVAGVMLAARAQSGQPNMGVAFELDAIAAAVIGGTSLAGGVGRITGTVIGVIILGVVTSGFTFLKVGAYYQEIVKGAIIVTAVVIDVHRQKKKSRA